MSRTTRFAMIVAAVALAMQLLAPRAQAANKTWDGGSQSWTEATNWDADTLPNFSAPGDNITFNSPDGTFGDTYLDAAVTVNSLTFNTLLGGSIDSGIGGPLTITSGSLTRNDLVGDEGDVAIYAPVVLGNNGTWNINGAGAVSVWGGIGGSGKSLTKTGAGTLTLTGYGQHTYGATVVQQGLLLLDNSIGALPGTLTIGVSGGATAGTVRLVQSSQLGSGTITIYGGSVLDFDGKQNGQIGVLTATDASVVNGSNLLASSMNLVRSSASTSGPSAISALTLTGVAGTGAGSSFVGDSSSLTISGALNVTDGSVAGVTTLTAAAISTARGVINASSINVDTGMTVTASSAVTAGGALTMTSTTGTLSVTSSTVSAASVAAANVLLQDATLSVGGGSGSMTVSGTLQVNGVLNAPSTIAAGGLTLGATTGANPDGEEPVTHALFCADSGTEVDLTFNTPIHGGAMNLSPYTAPGVGTNIAVLFNAASDFVGQNWTQTRRQGLYQDVSVTVPIGLDISAWIYTGPADGKVRALVGADNALGNGAVRLGRHFHTQGGNWIESYGGPRTINNPIILFDVKNSGFVTPYNLTVTGKISDSWGTGEMDEGSWSKYGAADLILTNTNSDWWQETYVREGRVVMNGKHKAWAKPNTLECEHPEWPEADRLSSNWWVYSGATVAGNGELQGKYVHILDGGHLQPGHDGIGTLTLSGYNYPTMSGYDPYTWMPVFSYSMEGKLFLEAGSNLDFQIGASGASDKVTTYDLILDGVMHVTNGGGGDAGRYTVMTCSHTLTNNGLTLDLSGLDISGSVMERPVWEYLQEFSSIQLNGGTIEAFIQGHAGDANLDGYVDVGDLGILATNYGATGCLTGGTGGHWRWGNFNLDNFVDVGDLALLATNYGWVWSPPGGAGGGMLPAAAPVPEPASACLIMLLSAACLRRRAGRR